MLKYTKSNEWLLLDGDVATVGITPFGQNLLGEVVFVELPTVGSSFDKDAAVGSVECVTGVFEFDAPVGGEVVAVNDTLDDEPGLVNAEPTGDGWLFKLKVKDAGELGTLLDEAAYQAYIAELRTE